MSEKNYYVLIHYGGNDGEEVESGPYERPSEGEKWIKEHGELGAVYSVVCIYQRYRVSTVRHLVNVVS